MLNKILDFLTASPAFREAFDAQSDGIAALYDMAEGQRPFCAAFASACSALKCTGLGGARQSTPTLPELELFIKENER